MPSNYFLHLEGIQGGAAHAKRQEWFELNWFRTGVGDDLSASLSDSHKGLQDVYIHCSNGKVIPRGIVEFLIDGRLRLRVKMDQLIVMAYKVVGKQVELGLSCEKIEYEYFGSNQATTRLRAKMSQHAP